MKNTDWHPLLRELIEQHLGLQRQLTGPWLRLIEAIDEALRKADSGKDQGLPSAPTVTPAPEISEWGLREKVAALERQNLQLGERLEQLLRSTEILQTQKLESLGQLAGGVAHDLNNILQIISGHIELAKLDMKPGDPGQEDLYSIAKATEKATSLVKQLLAFSRKQTIHPIPIHINGAISKFAQMFRRVLKANIALVCEPIAGNDLVQMDPMVFEQILMNLCLNARDAMPDGGEISIATHNLEEQGIPYLAITLSDTGTGIPPENLHNIYDPFFTSKEASRGTGLGLSVVHGAVRQHEGSIEVRPQINRTGTTFLLKFPTTQARRQSRDAFSKIPEPGRKEQPPRTVLIAEDETWVRRVAVKVLEREGFRVLQAEDGQEAIELLASYGQDINLVLLDVIMPKVGGRQIYQHMIGTHPGIPILFCSGYSDDDIDFIRQEDLILLEKPYTRRELLNAIHLVLDGKEALGRVDD